MTTRFDAGTVFPPAPRLAWDASAVPRLTGFALDESEQLASLAQLGCDVNAGDAIIPPWWRGKDLTESIDLVEEIARLHGYDKLPDGVPRLPAATPTANTMRQRHPRRASLVSAGMRSKPTVSKAKRGRRASATAAAIRYNIRSPPTKA